ncbi:MAG: hypothetical protein K8J08_19140 [Thermoanaerobaculia bacterium]|nr:hypothetical protein [Thermoanaerobaculia bacterium]
METIPPIPSVRRFVFAGLFAVVLASLTACQPSVPSPPGAEKAPATRQAAALQVLDPPAGPGAIAPNLLATSQGVLLTWMEPSDDGVFTLFYSRYESGRWTPRHAIASADDAFANWADLPAVAGSGTGILYAHWLSKLGTDTYAYGAELLRSEDGGESWAPLGWLHDDTSESEHGFVSYATSDEGVIQAFWLDGRAMPKGGAMQLRTTRLERAVAVAESSRSVVLDDRVCECCSTDAAWTASGPVVVYRDRSPEEVRDIAIVRAVDDGWSESSIIHRDEWTIEGCPVNGPAISAHGDRVAVAWFTAGGSGPSVQLALSDDGGAHFGPPIRLEEATPLGRVDVILTAGGNAVVSWVDTTETGAEVRWQSVSPGGAKTPVQVLTTTDPARSSGFPKLIAHGDQLLFAWIESGESPRLRAGLMALP